MTKWDQEQKQEKRRKQEEKEEKKEKHEKYFSALFLYLCFILIFLKICLHFLIIRMIDTNKCERVDQLY